MRNPSDLSESELEARCAAGDAACLYYLAWCLVNGSGRPRDAVRGLRAFRRAARAHRKYATYLGLSLLCGDDGLPSSPGEAIRWFRRAARRRDPDGMFHYGRCKSIGIGVKQSTRSARHWYRLASEAGSALGHFAFAHALLASERVAKSAKARAMKLLVLAAPEIAEAAREAGQMLLWGVGVESDRRRGIRFLRCAARASDAIAHYELARCYQIGFGTRFDEKLASSHMRMAADLGLDRAASG